MEVGSKVEADGAQNTALDLKEARTEPRRTFTKPQPHRPPATSDVVQTTTEDAIISKSRAEGNILASRPRSESLRNLHPVSQPNPSEQDREDLVAQTEARTEVPRREEGKDYKEPESQAETFSHGATAFMSSSIQQPDASPIASSVMRNMVSSHRAAALRSMAPSFGNKARVVNKRQREKEQKIAERMARLGHAPDPEESEEEEPTEYNLGEPEKYTFTAYKFLSRASETEPGEIGAGNRTSNRHYRSTRRPVQRPASAKPKQLQNDDLPYSGRVAVSKKAFVPRPLSAPISRTRRQLYTGREFPDVSDLISGHEVRPVVMPKTSDPFGNLKLNIFGLSDLDDDELEGPDSPLSGRNEDPLSERSAGERSDSGLKARKGAKKKKEVMLDTFEVLIEGAGEGSLAYFLAHGADKAEPKVKMEQVSKRPWRDKIQKSAVMLQCAVRMHQAVAVTQRLRSEWEEAKARQHIERKRGLKKRLMNAARLWGKVKRSVDDDHYSKSEEVCMVRAEEARLVARAMMVSGQREAAAHRLLKERASAEGAWHVLPQWVQNDLGLLLGQKTEKALFHQTEKMGLHWTNVGINFFASYSQRYVRIWSMDQAVEVMMQEDVEKVAAGLGLWLHKLGPIVERKHLPRLGQSLQWIRMSGYNVARAIRSYLDYTKFITEYFGKDGFTPFDQTGASDIQEVEWCGLYWLRNAHGGALTDSDDRGVVVVHPAMLRSMQHSQASPVADGVAKGLCTEGRLLWRLSVFMRMLLDAIPEAQVNGITVLVDVTDERPAGLSYALLQKLQAFVLGTYPSVVRKVVIFGPRRNVMTGWATASRLLLPAIAAELVYADCARCNRFTLKAISRELGIPTVGIPSGASCPVDDDEEEDDTETESVARSGSPMSSVQVSSQVEGGRHSPFSSSLSGTVHGSLPVDGGGRRSVMASVRSAMQHDSLQQDAAPKSHFITLRGVVHSDQLETRLDHEPAEETTVDEAAAGLDDACEEVVFLEEHNFAQEALLMGDGWYGSYDTSSGTYYVAEGAKKIAAMPRKKAADHPGLQEISSIPVLLGALVSYSMQSRTQAARELALRCRGRHSEVRDAVTAARGARRVAGMLGTEDPVEQEVTCDAIAGVCAHSPENSAMVWEGDGGSKLLNLLKVGQVRVRGAAAMALAAICEACDAACEAMSRGAGIEGLLDAVRRGPDRIREGACLAIAAVCAKADGAKAIMDRGGVEVVAKAMGQGGMGVRAAAARAVEGMLHREWEGRIGVSRQLGEAGGFLLISDLIHAGAAERAGAAELDCARSAAAAAARACGADVRVAGELGRGGFVGYALRLSQVSEPVNKVVRTLAARSGGVIETSAFVKAVRSVARRDGGPEALREFLDPEGDGYILEEDWFAAQQSILETLEAMLDSDLQVSSEDTCTDLSREESRLGLILERCLVRPQAVQIRALGVLRRVCQHETHGPSSAETLATLGAVKSLMDLMKREPLSVVHSRGIELLLEASKASEKFRRIADQAGVITVLKSVQHRAQQQAAPDVLGAGERCLAFYMRQEAGLLYTMQAGEVDEQEKAAAAIWHMSANRPSVRGAILGKKGIVETVAWNGVSDRTCAETKLTFSNSETVVNRHHSKIARRSSLNALRVLGQVPYETEMPEEKPLPKRIKGKSKLRRWMDYQNQPIHTLPYRPKVRASIEGWQGF